MQLKSIRIQNFRSYRDETITFDSYTCMVGPNGAGKSTVLTALNVFFRQFRDSKTDLSRLRIDDFHHKNIDEPIVLTVTFINLTEQAKLDLKDYVRQDTLVISATAEFDHVTQRAEIRQYGSRFGIEAFRCYFEGAKDGLPVRELSAVYSDLQKAFADLPNVKTKDAMISALHEYEASHPDECTLIKSHDQFYGATKGINKLAPHVQWVFVPASKDASEEAVESKSSALGQLLARTIRASVDFESELSQLRHQTKAAYDSLLTSKQAALDGLSSTLGERLKRWSHPNASASLQWSSDEEKVIRLEDPWAVLQLGEGSFSGEVSRFGHGMQRSYLLTLLELISESNSDNAPALIMGIEEPELYQHPPQVRYISELLRKLGESGSQIIICTHSPYLIPAHRVDQVRLIREVGEPPSSRSSSICYEELRRRLAETNKKESVAMGLLARLYPTLQPQANEIFFCQKLVLVEGIEDIAYLMANIHCRGLMDDYRARGIHIIPVGGKSEIARPLAISQLLEIPTFVMFDADTDTSVDKTDWIAHHKSDNSTITKLLGLGTEHIWPDSDQFLDSCVIWASNITDRVTKEGAERLKVSVDKAALHYGQAPNLKKNPLPIAWALEDFYTNGGALPSLDRVVDQMMAKLTT